ncbi:interleukin-1 receptor type 1 isoform X2 [Labrus bergylta]|uniref:interleukin-1 receptor type 1 isoform X2 n=1 Tax=Labrus bergylta TaxID=56723 RepID=UPI0033141543
MDSSRLLFSVFFLLITTSDCSDTDELQCNDMDNEIFHRLEGEAFYFLPYVLMDGNIPDENITWHKNNSEEISNNEDRMVHYHGGALFFLNLQIEDSGFYTAQHRTSSGECFNYHLKLVVFDKSHANTEVLFRTVSGGSKNRKIPCPDNVKETCSVFRGKLSWEKDSNIFPDEHGAQLWIMDVDKSQEGIYTCVCTWKHHEKEYKTSGSRKLEVEDTDELQCNDMDNEIFHQLEGEAFYFLPYVLMDGNIPDENITWHKNNSEEISNNEDRMVHYHGGALFFLNLQIEDSGFYTAQHRTSSGECLNYHLELVVFDKSHANTEVLFHTVSGGSKNRKIPCPDNVKETCSVFGGKLLWEKDSNIFPDEHDAQLWIMDVDKSQEGIYTCVCTWKHHEKEYKTSGSRKLEVEDQVVVKPPKILSPANKEQFADEGLEIKLNCSVLCGKNVGNDCQATWQIDGSPISQIDGYNLTTKREEPADGTTVTAILTIKRVSAKDFLAEFTCTVHGGFEPASATLTLKPKESKTPLIIGALSVLFFCVFAAVLIKYFAIDLALLFRPYFTLALNNKDGRVFDAYVVYQTQNLDNPSEDTFSLFVTKNLPSVLEEKCGYRLFIQGRDDIPGEDRLELVEDRMNQSRRLMVILTPGSESESSPTSPQNSVIGGFDWQVGLHHALVQREMNVILIQLGDMGPEGYAHLPPGLQHLIHKSAPIKWPEDSRGASAYNSRFWKRVRYLMPVTPAKKDCQSLII